ncbi:MAG TPA: TIGR00341 family protein [Candidatus Cryptobacteroides intestinipullorum]|nr:TIGR00341 family protein [Candidatus Cryptobacteroides intestinipullorum]
MSFWNNLKAQISSIASLSEHIDTFQAEKAIRNSIYFKGPNVWILVFSIIIASVGLNVNSIPVIIGAMLISPLLGPIFGIGLGLGINDTGLLKSSLKNILVMMLISLVASFLYFLITPLSLSNPTELLARTNPTIYDVLIALFGGFAGIFELSRKEKGTVFSGVAIATALMPPLCTAGFGLANGNLMYFIGALYLFTINCIFIILATYLTVKYMKFEQYEYKDERTGKRARRLITIVTAIVVVPSIWSAIVMVRENTFNQDVAEFINMNKNLYSGYIMDYKVEHRKGSRVEVYFTGEPLSASEKNNFLESAKEFGLKPEQVIIKEHALVEGTGEAEILKGIYERTDNEITRREAEIKKLEDELKLLHASDIPYSQITREAVNQYPELKSLFVARGAEVRSSDFKESDGLLAVATTTRPLSDEQKLRLKNWLRIRLGIENVTLYEITATDDK